MKLFRIYARIEPNELHTYYVIDNNFQSAAEQIKDEEVVMVEVLGTSAGFNEFVNSNKTISHVILA